MIFRIPYIISKFSFMTYGTVLHFTVPVPYRTSTVHQYGTYSLYGFCMVLVHSAVTERYRTVRYSTGTIQYRTVPYGTCTVWYCTVPYLSRTAQYGTIPYQSCTERKVEAKDNSIEAFFRRHGRRTYSLEFSLRKYAILFVKKKYI
jgi:hypothetical protein